MTVYQLLPTASPDTAIWHEVLEIKKIIQELNFPTEIFAENIHPELLSEVKPYRFCRAEKDDVVIYHYSIGSELNSFVLSLNCKLIMIYHNITPAYFFDRFDDRLRFLTESGRKELKSFLNSNLSICIADSEFNKNELCNFGFKNVYVLPIILNIKKYRDEISNPKIKFGGDYKNFLFVGRIAPNKKIEDLIKLYFIYKRSVDSNVRLIIVGSYEENEYKKYYYTLNSFINELHLNDVFFTGKISFKDMVTIYRQSHIFITMSEHEGFCVPLVEAMIFGVPIIAFNSTAIPETLGDSGILVNKKNYTEIAELVDIVLSDSLLRSRIIDKQYKRLSVFDTDKLKQTFIDIIRMVL